MMAIVVSDLVELTGVPDAAIRLLLSILAGYVLGILHHHLISKLSSSVQHIFFISSSSCLYYWNYGTDIYHAYICILVQWGLLRYFKGSMFCVFVSFLFQMIYLVWGYYQYATDDYDINWLMPHCVLTLRLIGLAFDVFDGHKDEKYLGREQIGRKISDIPNLLEVLGFCFFPSGYLVGPQFPLVRVRKLVDGTLVGSSVTNGSRYTAAFTQLFLGIFFLLLHTYVSMTFNTDFYLTPEFKEMPFLQRSGYVAVTGYFTLLRYVTVWMINEGACILFGIGYQQDAKTGEHRWDAVRNAKIWHFLFSTSFQGLIECFNLNTNDWVLRYVFKRLRFMGNRMISHFSALFFLAVWHGVHVGYFTCFAYEFLTMTSEKSFRAFLESTSFVKHLRSSQLLSWIPTLIGFVYLHALSGYALIDFTMLKWHRYKPVLDSLYWQGHVFFISTYILVTILAPLTKKRPSEKTE